MLALLAAASILSATPAHDELTFSPAAEYLPKFTHHEGTQLRYAHAVAPGLRLFVQWREHWSTGTTGFSQELVDAVRESPQSPVRVLLRRAITAGVSAHPVRAELPSGRTFTIGLAAGAGYGETAFELRPDNMPSLVADIGPRLTGYGAVELALHLNDRCAVTASFDDLFFTSSIDQLNGCRAGDLAQADAALRSGKGLGQAQVGSDCDLASFPSPEYVRNATSTVGGRRFGLPFFSAPPPTETRHVRAVTLGVTLAF